MRMRIPSIIIAHAFFWSENGANWEITDPPLKHILIIQMEVRSHTYVYIRTL